MSIYSVAWALTQTGLSPTTKFVLVALADYSDDDGLCWPGQKRIAAKVGISQRQLQRHLSDLSSRSIIAVKIQRRDDGSRMSNEYVLNIPKMSLGSDTGVRGVATLASGGGKEEKKKSPPHPLLEEEKKGDEPSFEPEPSLRSSSSKTARSTTDPHYTQEFERFWFHYPRKVGKGAAWKVWHCNGRPCLDDILQAVEVQKQTEQWQRDGGQYIPYPATWLNQRRWDDQPDIPETTREQMLRLGLLDENETDD